MNLYRLCRIAGEFGRSQQSFFVAVKLLDEAEGGAGVQGFVPRSFFAGGEVGFKIGG
jgi:hypothetical protein